MSKANRIKGVFSEAYGCRMSSPERCESLERRKDGLTQRHQPTPSQRVAPKLTKAMRKQMAKISPEAMKHLVVGMPFEMARN